MAVTDQDILNEIQRVTLEGVGDNGVTWPSGMWSAAEVLGYLNQRQNRWLAATGLCWTVRETVITANVRNQAMPTDWIATVFNAWKTSAGVYNELPKFDALGFDYSLATWPTDTAATPKGYLEADGDTLTTQIVPIPTDVGAAIERYYVALGTTLDASGVDFSIPDEFVPGLKYGVLADMFNKVGQAANSALVEACEARWEEGVQLGMLMATEGWLAL
jgi:hypothetical protein